MGRPLPDWANPGAAYSQEGVGWGHDEFDTRQLTPVSHPEPTEGNT